MSQEGKKEDALDDLSVKDPATFLAAVRTRFAADRTLMAWVRTAISMITFGFVIFKFFQYLDVQENGNRVPNARQLGLFLILLGILSITLGMFEHYVTLNRLKKYGTQQWSHVSAIGIIAGIIGFYALAAVVKIRFF